MKKAILYIMACGLAPLMSAESVTIVHSQSGALASELSDCGVSAANITELTVTGDAVMTADDFAAIRSALAKSLKVLDLSGAAFEKNILPGTGVKTAGVLNNMAITECRLPETLTALSEGAFVKCASLQKVNIPEGVKIIPQYCFNKCAKLSDVILPEGLVRIDIYSFEGCTSLKITELPSTVITVSERAFNNSKVALTHLPEGFTAFAKYSFTNSDVTFTELPAAVTTLPEGVFLGTKVNFRTLPPQIKSVGARVFESVRTLTYFEITDVAGLSTTIPKAFFHIANDDVERTFVCRSATPPAATVSTTDNNGSFGKVAEFKNTTFMVPYTALEAYAAVEPYSTMNLQPISVAVNAPLIEYPANVMPEHINVSYVVGDIAHTDFSRNVIEGDGKLVVSFAGEAANNLYVDAVFCKPAVSALSDGDENVPDEWTQLYKCADPANSLLKTVEVPVTVNAAMGAHRIVIGEKGDTTGLDEITGKENTFSVSGNVIEVSDENARLYDTVGRVVAAARGGQISIAGLAHGIYMLQTGNSVKKVQL